MQKYLIILIVIFSTSLNASNKDQIIKKLQTINNISFNFEHTINDKNEIGYCTVQYPKKMFCEYENKKIVLSNGLSLFIKNFDSELFYLYPIKKTLFNFLLDKDFLIKKILNLEERIVDNKYINFLIEENGNLINIFFDKETFILVGWQTEDIYQNLNITFLTSLKINKKINQKIFEIPEKK